MLKTGKNPLLLPPTVRVGGFLWNCSQTSRWGLTLSVLLLFIFAGCSTAPEGAKPAVAKSDLSRFERDNLKKTLDSMSSAPCNCGFGR